MKKLEFQADVDKYSTWNSSISDSSSIKRAERNKLRRRKRRRRLTDLEKYTTTKQNPQPQNAQTHIQRQELHVDFFFHIRLPQLGTRVLET